MEKKVYELTIDPELRDFIPPLSGSELELLTESLIEEGCNEPLIVWNGIIVDGHNRYQICHENNIPFSIQEMDFENKEKAKLWMVRRQLGRRNLKPFQRCELVFPLEKAITEEVEKRRRIAIGKTRKGKETGSEVNQSKRTGDYMAEYADVSRTIWHMAKKLIEEGDEILKEQLRKDDVGISVAYKEIQDKANPPKHGSKLSKTAEAPPILAAHLEHSMPFVPVQPEESKDEETPVKPDETVISDFRDLMRECAEDAKEILEDAGKMSADTIQQIRTELTHCYRFILDKLEQVEAEV